MGNQEQKQYMVIRGNGDAGEVFHLIKWAAKHYPNVTLKEMAEEGRLFMPCQHCDRVNDVLASEIMDVLLNKPESKPEAPPAVYTCYDCGHEGPDVSQQDWYNPVTKHDSTRYLCDDWESCADRRNAQLRRACGT